VVSLDICWIAFLPQFIKFAISHYKSSAFASPKTFPMSTSDKCSLKYRDIGGFFIVEEFVVE